MFKVKQFTVVLIEKYFCWYIILDENNNVEFCNETAIKDMPVFNSRRSASILAEKLNKKYTYKFEIREC